MSSFAPGLEWQRADEQKLDIVQGRQGANLNEQSIASRGV
jgi:hypothetical protein